MAKDFKIIEDFVGYRNKTDITKQDPRVLVSGSKNVIINDGDKVSIRSGYSLYGAANAALTPIEESIDWDTSTGTEMRLRSYDDELEFLYNDTWYRLADGFSSVTFKADSWWDNTEKLDKLLLINGDSNLYSWSGGIATFASATSNTITKEGTATWGEARFLLGGTTQVIIEGTTYTYTGGEGTTTLTGVTPDPTVASHTVGAVAHQALQTDANTPASGVDNDIIRVLNNQVYIADTQQRSVYVSANDDFTDFTFSSPRTPGQGALLTLDSAPNGFAIQEDAMYISAGKNDWYQVVFTLSADLTNEILAIEKLKSGPQQSAKEQSLIGHIKNSVVYISNEPTFDSLGRVENINTPQSLPLSDPIKADFDSYDFTGGHIMYWKNKSHIALPAEGVVLIYDHERKYWNPPQILPVKRFSIIGGHLYGHSSVVPETYKLFDTTTYSDNDNAIEAIAAFAYRSYGNPDRKKVYDEYYVEGKISANTTIDVSYVYDYSGYESISEDSISGAPSTLIFSAGGEASIGNTSLGSVPIGNTGDTIDNLNKFRVIHTMDKIDFYEHQVIFSSNDKDYQWEVLRHGGNIALSNNDSTEIKR